MRLLPAHVQDAKEMARALCDCLLDVGVTMDDSDPSAPLPTLQRTQELMAKAFGYASWRELCALLKQPHKPYYLDEMMESELPKHVDLLGSRLAALLGLGVENPLIWLVLDDSGVGHKPKTRRVRWERKIARARRREMAKRLGKELGIQHGMTSPEGGRLRSVPIGECMELEVTLRSRATFGESKETIRVWYGQSPEDVAERIAKGYGAEVVEIRNPDGSVYVVPVKVEDSPTPGNCHN